MIDCVNFFPHKLIKKTKKKQKNKKLLTRLNLSIGQSSTINLQYQFQCLLKIVVIFSIFRSLSLYRNKRFKHFHELNCQYSLLCKSLCNGKKLSIIISLNFFIQSGHYYNINISRPVLIWRVSSRLQCGPSFMILLTGKGFL